MYDEDVSDYEIVIRFKFASDDVKFEEIQKDYPNLSPTEALRCVAEEIKQDLLDEGYSDCEVEVKDV